MGCGIGMEAGWLGAGGSSFALILPAIAAAPSAIATSDPAAEGAARRAFPRAPAATEVPGSTDDDRLGEGRPVERLLGIERPSQRIDLRRGRLLQAPR